MSNFIQSAEKRFFRRKKVMEDPNNQPTMQTEEVSSEAEAQTPVQPAAESVAEAPVSDRASFNCPDCKGEGLKDQYSVCPRCLGTGKV